MTEVASQLVSLRERFDAARARRDYEACDVYFRAIFAIQQRQLEAQAAELGPSDQRAARTMRQLGEVAVRLCDLTAD